MPRPNFGGGLGLNLLFSPRYSFDFFPRMNLKIRPIVRPTKKNMRVEILYGRNRVPSGSQMGGFVSICCFLDIEGLVQFL